MAPLYRCPAPTDVLCRCGTAARRLRPPEIELDDVGVPSTDSWRPEAART